MTKMLHTTVPCPKLSPRVAGTCSTLCQNTQKQRRTFQSVPTGNQISCDAFIEIHCYPSIKHARQSPTTRSVLFIH